jgi:hypothetical protein
MDVPLFSCSRSRRLVTISHQPPTLPTAVSRMPPNDSSSSLYRQRTSRRENTASNSSSTFAYMPVVTITWGLLRHCLANGEFAEPFPSNGCPCWFQNLRFRQKWKFTFSDIWYLAVRQKWTYISEEHLPPPSRYNRTLAASNQHEADRCLISNRSWGVVLQKR